MNWLADRLAVNWGKPVIVENITGASGNIAVDRVAKAPRDGYTLVMGGNSSLIMAVSLNDRLPYDPAADLTTQVAQSMASSLEHLGTDHVDSYVLHGPSSGYGWTDDDTEVWAAMARERDAARTRVLGVSNVSLRHLEQMAALGLEMPAFVQNRCFARRGWDRAVRAFCADRRIVYQGFSLLTANVEVLHHPEMTRIATRLRAAPTQVVFRFALAVGMLPLTGTSDALHMTQDLASRDLALSADDARTIESLLA